MEDQTNKMDRIVYKLADRLAEWEKFSLAAIDLDTSFKSYQASATKAYMDAGCSHVKARIEVEATPQWSEQYRALGQANLRVELAKKQMAALDLQFRAEQTKQANQRRIV